MARMEQPAALHTALKTKALALEFSFIIKPLHRYHVELRNPKQPTAEAASKVFAYTRKGEICQRFQQSNVLRIVKERLA